MRQQGVSPCQMMFGREINLPVDLVFVKPVNDYDATKSTIDYAYELETVLNDIHDYARSKINLASNSIKKYMIIKFTKINLMWVMLFGTISTIEKYD